MSEYTGKLIFDKLSPRTLSDYTREMESRTHIIRKEFHDTHNIYMHSGFMWNIPDIITEQLARETLSKLTK